MSLMRRALRLIDHLDQHKDRHNARQQVDRVKFAALQHITRVKGNLIQSGRTSATNSD